MHMEERFLALYKEMEGLLKIKYKEQSGRSGVVMKFLHAPEGRPYRERLNTCREIRNILAHSPDIAGEAPLIPSAGVVHFMEELVNYLKKPPTILENATPFSHLVTADLEMPVHTLMQRMQKEGFSHIPVLENHRLFGIFSASIFFSFVLEGKHGFEIEKLSDVKSYLPIKRHIYETFLFIRQNAAVEEARVLFDRKRGPQHRRLAALFITENGNPDEPLLGMATPWDVMLDEER